MKYVVAAAAFALVQMSGTASAVPIGFQFNAGQVIDIPNRQSSLADVFDDFILGEDLLVDFRIESSTPDLDPTLNRGLFLDPLGSLIFTGAVSGATFSTFGGVALELDATNEFDISSFFEGPLPEGEFELFDDIDVTTAESQPLLTDPDDLVRSITELSESFTLTALGIRNRAQSSSGQIGFRNRRDRLRSALEFGPVASVPVPAALPLMIGALGVLLVGARRRRS